MSTPLNVTHGERSLLRRQLRHYAMSSFENLLWQLIECADQTNLNGLAEAFPSHVEAYRNYIGTENWWQELLERAHEVDRGG